MASTKIARSANTFRNMVTHNPGERTRTRVDDSSKEPWKQLRMAERGSEPMKSPPHDPWLNTWNVPQSNVINRRTARRLRRAFWTEAATKRRRRAQRPEWELLLEIPRTGHTHRIHKTPPFLRLGRIPRTKYQSKRHPAEYQRPRYTSLYLALL